MSDSNNVLSTQGVSVDRKPFASLMNNPQDLRRTLDAISNAILRSFAVDAQREFRQPKITQNELKHRFKICESFFRYCRGDLGFSLEKTLDLVGHALRCELDEVDYDPSTATTSVIWTPT